MLDKTPCSWAGHMHIGVKPISSSIVNHIIIYMCLKLDDHGQEVLLYMFKKPLLVAMFGFVTLHLYIII